MFRKLYFTSGLLTILILALGTLAFTQTAPVRGEVKLKKSDGTVTPVNGALVEAYRTDIDKGKMPSAKTNKRGEFNFVGFQLGQTYVLVVSGEGISPALYPNVKAGREDIVVEVSDGDGKVWTEEQVRGALKGAPANQGGGAKELTAAQKKEQEDLIKKNEEIKKKNEQAENTNKIVNAAFQEGDKLYKAKDYAGAVAKFDEGINADPEFEGSAPVLLNYKAVALKDRGFESYKQSTSAEADAKAAAMEKAKVDFLAAIEALEKAKLILKNAPAATDPTAQKNVATTKLNILANEVEIFRLIVRTRADVSKAKDAGPTFEEYIALETDPAKKLTARLTLGDIMQEAGETQAALDSYMAVLQTAPDNVDALAGAGFSLVNLGYLNNDKTKFQEAVNYLQKFIASAPDTNKYKADAVSLIDTLKKEQNVTPQKAASGPKKKNN
jgi:tetratricopeptide (TPR) repeat protein